MVIRLITSLCEHTLYGGCSTPINEILLFPASSIPNLIEKTRSGPKIPAAGHGRRRIFQFEQITLSLQVRLRSNEHYPWLQRDMLSTRVTLNPMVLVGNMLGSVYLVNM